MTFIGWLFVVGGLVSAIFENYAGGTYWTLVGLAFIIAGVGYNVQVEIRKKNQELAAQGPMETTSPKAGVVTNPGDHELREVVKPQSRSAYDRKVPD
jgi:hypothetical protein